MDDRRRPKHIPKISLGSLIGATTIVFISLPLVIVLATLVARDPAKGLIAVVLSTPIWAPSTAAGFILWSAMMENLSRPTIEHLRERRHAERSLWS